MNDKRLEQVLRNAPTPAIPPRLAERLEEVFDQPQESATGARRSRFKIRYLVPAASLAASFVALAVVLFSPAPVAYSFEKSVEAFRNVRSVTVVHKIRSGPPQPQPLPASAGGEGTTTRHPANPFATVEVRRRVVDGREMSHMRGVGQEVIRNGPLGLKIDTETGERTFFLDGLIGSAEALLDPEDWLLELEEQASRGEVRYEVEEESGSAGNLEVVIRSESLGKSEFIRLWVNAETWLPVRLQVVSTDFPEFGPEVVMNELVLQDADADFDDEIFEVVPTDAELAQFGLDREELIHLPASATSIEIGGDLGRRVLGTIIEGNRSREMSATLPVVLVESPAGEMFIDLRTEDGEPGSFDVRIGGSRSTIGARRVVIHLGEEERGVSAVPLDVKDVATFKKRSRESGW